MKSVKLTPAPFKTSLKAIFVLLLIAVSNLPSFAQGNRYLSFSPSSLSFSVNQNGTTPAKTATLTASRGNPEIRLSKSNRSNWLILPSSPNLGSLSFSINSAGLTPGTYLATVTARANNYYSSTMLVVLQVKTNNTLPSILFARPSDTIEVAQGGTQSLLEYISTSNSTPVNVSLTAAGEDGNTPSWLSVNGNLLNGINYTTGSEITFSVDATTLSIGTYIATVTAAANGYYSGVLNVIVNVKAGSTGVLTDIMVNFQDAATVPPAGWIADFGQSFGPRTSNNQGTGNIYGWIKRSDATPLDLTLNGRKRNTPADLLLATLMHMQGGDVATFAGTKTEGIWEAQVVNGVYDITVSVGDGTAVDSRHSINVEGVPAIINFVPTTNLRFKNATISVSVTDGLLTVDAIGGKNTKINYIIVKPTTTRRPSVVVLNPDNGSVNVSENTSISTSILNLPNAGIDNATILPATVYLSEALTGTRIAANVNGTGGGDAITLVPSAPLKLSTAYEFHITDGVKDLSGASFIPYTSSFITGAVSTTETINAKFNKVLLPNTTGRHSSLTIGPDGKLYALSIDGIIKRFVINPDGTLQTPELLYSLQDAYGARQSRLAIGLAFSPTSTATDLTVYITHSTFVFLNGPDWDGKLTRLSGPNLENVQDILVNLPRSSKDHLTNSIAFGPDGKLYFTQGCNSAMGKADQTWSLRDEHLLSAALLQLDLQKLSSLPLNVKTAEGAGPYNPYAIDAPLTIYASGVRNAYDLVWHTNGELYVPANGSAAGGNTPASVMGAPRPDGSGYNGPTVPSLTNVRQTQKDFLFRINKGGYYGHPNPLRGEFVMNGGNPSAAIDPAQVDEYPLGVMPDANYRGFSFDFQANKSPNGAIEYKSNSFHGALKGKLMVVRFSQNDDIITLTPGGINKDIISYNEGASIQGFSGFIDPLDLTEDTATGNIYVSEYGGDGSITLLSPTVPPSNNPEVNVEVGPIADAFTRNGTYAGINYGLDTVLTTKTYNKSANFTRNSYLKFPLTGVTDVISAKLRIYGRNPETTAQATLSLFGVGNDAWTETGINFNNAPAITEAALANLVINNTGKYFELDVTNFVKAQFALDKMASFVINDPLNQNVVAMFSSRENLTNKPQLVIITSAVAEPPVEEPEVNVEVAPVEDAFTRNGTFAGINYGLDTVLATKTYNKSANFTRNAYLKFPLTGVSDVISAKLRIYGRNPETTAQATLSLFGLGNDTWAETGITFTNAPAIAGTALTTFVVNNTGQYFELDVTNFVKDQFALDKIASFIINDPLNQNVPAYFNSRENSTNKPQLVITTSAVAEPADAQLSIENPDKFPSNDLFIAGRIHIPWTRDAGAVKIYNGNHDTVKIKISNKGTDDLLISNLIRSNNRNWQFLLVNGIAYDSATAFPITVAPGSVIDITLQFVEPTDLNTRYRLFSNNLTIISNDIQFPTKTIYLNGMWQRKGEGSNEPRLAEMLTAFGFKTTPGFTNLDPDQGNPQKPKGSEILSSHFVRADVTKPVSVIQVAAYHECCRNVAETINWYAKTSSTPELVPIVTHQAVDGQSIMPRKQGENGISEGSFEPTEPFGFKIGTLDWTDTLRNPGGKIGVRIWKAIDAAGVVIPNEYFVANDYLGTSFTNYDYNDNIYYVKNVMPEPVVPPVASPVMILGEEMSNNLVKARVYPNPLRNKFNIQFPSAYRGDVRLQLSDITGRIFDLGRVDVKANGAGTEVDISRFALKPGVYFLRINNTDLKSEFMKLIVR